MNAFIGPGSRRRRLWIVGTVTGLMVLASAPAAQAVPECFGEEATIVGTNGPDNLEGTAGNDVIVGGGGDDVINGNGGDDRICGNDGGDELDVGGDFGMDGNEG